MKFSSTIVISTLLLGISTQSLIHRTPDDDFASIGSHSSGSGSCYGCSRSQTAAIVKQVFGVSIQSIIGLIAVAFLH